MDQFCLIAKIGERKLQNDDVSSQTDDFYLVKNFAYRKPKVNDDLYSS
jgi:hypothetical protein